MIAPVASDASDKILAGFLQDWAGPLYTSGNGGASNRYWHSKAEPTLRFQWSSGYSTLSTYNGTPAEENGRYLTIAERDAALVAAGIPPSQEAH
jgi:hypothetical protein